MKFKNLQKSKNWYAIGLDDSMINSIYQTKTTLVKSRTLILSVFQGIRISPAQSETFEKVLMEKISTHLT